jgi:hypothetical protein
VAEELTHKQLVEYAARWLRNKHPVIVTELATIGEEADAIGFYRGFTTLVECKVSRSDFLSDGRKYFRRHPENGIGDYRYYMAPRGLIAVQEIPASWGLLEIHGSRVFMKQKAVSHACANRSNERGILISVLQRIGQTPVQGVSIRCYVYDTKNRATVRIETATEES